MIRLWDLRAKKSFKIDTPDEVSLAPLHFSNFVLRILFVHFCKMHGKLLSQNLWVTTNTQVLNVAYSADGDYIAMSDKSENLRLVDVRNGKNKVSQDVKDFVRYRRCA